MFDEITLLLEPAYADGKSFTLRSTPSAPGELYIQAAKLDGAPLDLPVLSHARLVEGGTLELLLGAEPSDWGTGLCAP